MRIDRSSGIATAHYPTRKQKYSPLFTIGAFLYIVIDEISMPFFERNRMTDTILSLFSFIMLKREIFGGMMLCTNSAKEKKRLSESFGQPELLVSWGAGKRREPLDFDIS